jgi:hypothetical protein
MYLVDDVTPTSVVRAGTLSTAPTLHDSVDMLSVDFTPFVGHFEQFVRAASRVLN